MQFSSSKLCTKIIGSLYSFEEEIRGLSSACWYPKAPVKKYVLYLELEASWFLGIIAIRSQFTVISKILHI